MGAGTTQTVSEQTTSNVPPTGEGSYQLGGKFVTFFLGVEEYGLEILKVREIIGMLGITPVPQTPEFVRGVINLRGKIIPIVDLRARFQMESVEESRENCVIVVRAHGIDMGIVVDKMSEVVDIDSDKIEEAPSLGTEVNIDFILGMDKSQDRVKLLLDIEKVLSSRELNSIQGVQNEQESKAEVQ